MKIGLFIFAIYSGLAFADIETDRIQAPVAPSERLEYFLMKAQSSYFTGEEQELALELYQEVASLKDAKVWTQEQKKSIHFSMLRVSQLSLTPELRDEWLKRAIQYFPQQNMDADLFPPPLVSRFNSLKSEIPVAPRVQDAVTTSVPEISQNTITELEPQPTYSQSIEPPLKDSKPLWKNKWIWAGVGALVAGYVIYDNNQQKKEDKQSSSVTYGF